MTKPLIIVGLQKSGTTILKKILASSDKITNLFAAEGNGFWGNLPPFSPSEEPVGRLYQQHGGNRGHYLSGNDFCKRDKMVIEDRLQKELNKCDRKPIWLHKSPYLTVRTAWLKKIFPDALILACVRKPLPNVFSLLKRYQYTAHGLAVEDGWWGVKPKNWKELICSEALGTAARQWSGVNHQLLLDSRYVDCFIPYHTLSTEPGLIIDHLSEMLNINLDCYIPELRCMDYEWQTGGSAISMNQQEHSHHKEKLEIQGLRSEQVAKVKIYCSKVWSHIQEKLISEQYGNITNKR